MNLPPPAPYPPYRFRKELVLEEWEACLDAWLSISEHYLRLNQEDFRNVAVRKPFLVTFLKSYYHETSNDQHNASSQKDKEQSLRKITFVLTHRAMLGTSDPSPVLFQWEFLSDFCHVYMKTHSLDTLIQTLGQRKGGQLEATSQDLASLLLEHLESGQPDTVYKHLKRVAPLLYTSPLVGKVLLTGSDLIDAMSTGYSKGSAQLRESLVTTAYLGILALMKGDKPNHSLIFDHLYGLRSQAEKESKASLLADLVTNTPILTKLRTGVSGKDAERAQNLAAALDKYRSPAIVRAKRPVHHITKKGKEKGPASNVLDSSSSQPQHMHMHHMSLITQIQDLFPDLGSAFVARLLDEYNESVEEATAHLLEDSLPPHLSSLDRTAQLPTPGSTSTSDEQSRIDHLAPRSTPPRTSSTLPERRNIFDNDAFDRLEIDSSRLHQGRRNADRTADDVLSDRTNAPAKSAILSALAAFDSDDDERDDTYDEADVGGLVDTARPDGEDRRDVDVSSGNGIGGAENEDVLFRAWQTDKRVFERTADVRRGPARAALKAQTGGLTDEAIEGWALMLVRDPRRTRRLERKSEAFHGAQNEIGRSAYREGDFDSEDGTGTGTDSDVGWSGGRGRGGRGRGGRGGGGGGRGRGGRGGANPAAAGAPGEKSTQIARARKEARGSSRRDGRARKMARAGFAG